MGEGPRGTLTKQAIPRLNLDEGREPQVYAAGVKELWKCKPGSVTAGSVIHTLGYPLPPETFGGGFIYGMKDDVLDIGHVTGLDYADPTTDPHNELQRMKQHPAIAAMLDGAKLIRYGAKAIPEGGLFAMPRLYADGLMLIGDSGGFLNGMRLKGVHLAMKSGAMAAETAWDALQANAFDAATLSAYEKRFHRAGRVAHRAQLPSRLRGQIGPGMLNAGLATFAGARFKRREAGGRSRTRTMKKAAGKPTPTPRATIDNALTFDKPPTSSTAADAKDQPAICTCGTISVAIGTVEYGNPCEYSVRPRSWFMFEKNAAGAVYDACRSITNCTARRATPDRTRSTPRSRPKAARPVTRA